MSSHLITIRDPHNSAMATEVKKSEALSMLCGENANNSEKLALKLSNSDYSDRNVNSKKNKHKK